MIPAIGYAAFTFYVFIMSNYIIGEQISFFQSLVVAGVCVAAIIAKYAARNASIIQRKLERREQLSQARWIAVNIAGLIALPVFTHFVLIAFGHTDLAREWRWRPFDHAFAMMLWLWPPLLLVSWFFSRALPKVPHDL